MNYTHQASSKRKLQSLTQKFDAIMNDDEITPDNYGNWFALYRLCQLTQHKTSIVLSTVQFGELLGLSQQTGSRRISELEKLGWIKKRRLVNKERSLLL